MHSFKANEPGVSNAKLANKNVANNSLRHIQASIIHVNDEFVVNSLGEKERKSVQSFPFILNESGLYLIVHRTVTFLSQVIDSTM